MTRRRGDWRAINGVALALAAFAAIWHVVLMTSATNDNFLHLTLAKQWLAGDWPVRDFFDQSSLLQYVISAVAQALGGDRLMSEAVVVGLAWAVSTYLVYALVHCIGGYPLAAAIAAFLPIAAGARGYSYPKGVIYAVAAALWWRYVSAPTTRRMISFGAWAAVAFYWRADHGIYVMAAVALACWAAHGMRLVAVTRWLAAAAVLVALIVPFFAYVHATIGLPEYARTALAAARAEHVTQGPHAWPLLRLGRDVVAIDSAEHYAPTIGIRWRPESSAEDRQRVLERYALVPLEADDGVERVRLSSRSIGNIRSLINERVVDDTAGVDRASGTLPSAAWPRWRQWKFQHAWLRVRILPHLDSPARASEIAVAMLYLLPIAMISTAGWLTRYLYRVSTAQVVAFAGFAFIVNLAMLRLPFPARMADAVVLPAVAFGCCLAAVWRAAGAARGRGRALGMFGAIALTCLVIGAVTLAGRFGERLTPLAGNGVSFRRAAAAWRGAFDELVASPPLAYYIDRRARFSLRLAAYVRDCVPPGDRLLVLWFEPEIYYYADRLMAQRHLVFAASWSNMEHEQRMTLDKIKRYSPPVALARRSALEGYARASFPKVIDYVRHDYQLQVSIADEGEEYLIFVRRDRPALRVFSHEGWPCFVPEGSRWSRVGRAGG